MTECNHRIFEYPTIKGRKIQASFKGGEVTSDGGVMLLRQVDRRLGLTEAVSQTLRDSRRAASCQHSLKSFVRQRVYGLALGYEDLNDHQSLRRDPAIQSAVGQDELLAGSPTLCRWDNRIKEQQLDLLADRTSCHRWWPNQFRLLLSGLAYMLVEGIRRLALAGTELARAQYGSIRLKLLKIGAVILRNTRRVQLLMSSSYPHQELFFKVATSFSSG
ncbi:MAG: transposase [candidate division Zixibacteria bacterium]|nr:transposase [candidate division Zixibacteria bacterium]